MIELNSTEPTSHIRITQTGSSPNKYWSIHELSLKGLPADTDLSGKSLAQVLAGENPEILARDAKASGSATRGAALFYNQALSCVKCHDPKVGDRLGPDLASKRDGVTDIFLVESILAPSKVIRKGYEPIIVQTEDGLVVTGFHVKEDEDILVLREPAGGKEITFDKEELLGMKQGKISAMPPGLINLLTDREQFLDLVKFLIDVNQGGPDKLNELKSGVLNK